MEGVASSVLSVNDGGAKECLSMKGWPEGLQDTFIRNISRFPIRYFIVDDSGSMATQDGHKISVLSNEKKMYEKDFYDLVKIRFLLNVLLLSGWFLVPDGPN